MSRTSTPTKLTMAIVDRLEPKPKDYFTWDCELKGFGIKTTKMGRKVYVVQFRIAGIGSTKRMTVGVHGETNCQQARNRAADILNDARKGINPTAEFKALKNAITVSEAMDRFFIEHVWARLKTSTANSYKDLRRVHLEPAFGKMKLTDVTRERVTKHHARFSHQRASANKQLAILSKFFNWCEGLELIQQGSNPCKFVEKFKEEGRERFLTAEELVRLRDVMNTAEANRLACKSAIDVIRLLLLTGARRNEILLLRWEYVDFENGTLNLPDSKTGKKSIVLSRAAQNLLATLNQNENPFVFPGKKPNSHLVNLKAPWQRIRTAAGLEGVRIHDLRHTFASHAINGGAPIEIISKLLGHSKLETTQRYAHLQDEKLRITADDVARRIGVVI